MTDTTGTNIGINKEEEELPPTENGVTDALKDHDAVNSPHHYTRSPSGIETIDITEHLNFCMGNAIKYIMRSDYKGEKKQDLEKASWYLQRELDRIDKFGV